MVAVALCVCLSFSGTAITTENERWAESFFCFASRMRLLHFSSVIGVATGVETSFSLPFPLRIACMPRGRGAPPRPVARAPTAKAKATKKPSRRRSRDDSDDDDRPGPADAFYEAEDVVAPEDAGGAKAMRFDVSFAS